MRRLGASGLAVLLLLASGVPAQAQLPPQGGGQPEVFTPRTPPTVSLPGLSVDLPAPRLPGAPRVPSFPPPVVATPLSPPGMPPGTATAAPSVEAAPPARAAAQSAVQPAAPPPARSAEERPAEDRKPAPAPAAPAGPAGRRSVWAESDVYVRAAPDRKSRIVTGLSRGDRLESLGAPVDDWIQVARDGKLLGYVHGGYLTDRAPVSGGATRGMTGGVTRGLTEGERAASPSEARAEDGCALPDDLTVTGKGGFAAGTRVRVRSDAYLRAGPACNARVLDVLEKGQALTVLATRGIWSQVGRGGRALGYVSSALLAAAPGR